MKNENMPTSVSLPLGDSRRLDLYWHARRRLLRVELWRALHEEGRVVPLCEDSVIIGTGESLETLTSFFAVVSRDSLIANLTRQDGRSEWR